MSSRPHGFIPPWLTVTSVCLSGGLWWNYIHRSSLWCINTTCDFRFPFTVNLLPQMWHSNGFSPVWIRKCLVRSPFSLNTFPQTGHSFALPLNKPEKQNGETFVKILLHALDKYIAADDWWWCADKLTTLRFSLDMICDNESIRRHIKSKWHIRSCHSCLNVKTLCYNWSTPFITADKILPFM